LDESVPTSILATLPLALTIVTVWLFVRQDVWILTDFLALCLGITAMTLLRLPSLKIAFVILCLFFLYDIFWVFVSPLLFGSSVMVQVAMGLPTLPIVILIPRSIISGFSLLGMGDITLPGLYLSYLRRFDNHRDNTHGIVGKYWGFLGYFGVGLLFYVLGLVLTLVMLVALSKPQPALLYLVPSILSSTMVFASCKGDFNALWVGFGSNKSEEDTGEEDMEIGVVQHSVVGADGEEFRDSSPAEGYHRVSIEGEGNEEASRRLSMEDVDLENKAE